LGLKKPLSFVFAIFSIPLMDKTVKTILKIGGIFAATQVYEVLVKGHMLYLVEPLLDKNVDFKSGADLICEPTKKLRYKSIMAVKDFFKKYDK
jgi:hypothetical protein